MSDNWLTGKGSKNNRILKAVNNDKALAKKIIKALNRGQVERVLSKIDSDGNVTTYRLDANGNIIGTWP